MNSCYNRLSADISCTELPECEHPPACAPRLVLGAGVARQLHAHCGHHFPVDVLETNNHQLKYATGIRLSMHLLFKQLLLFNNKAHTSEGIQPKSYCD